MADYGSDTYLNTGSTNFDKTIVATVIKTLQASLRAGLVYTPAGSVIPAQLVPGSNGTFRSFGVSDLPEDGEVDLETGDPDPDLEDLGLDFAEFTGKQVGRVIGIEDTAQDRSPFNLAAVAGDKISRAAHVLLDNVPRKLYLAAGADIYGGASNSHVGDLAAGDKMTASLIKDGVALLRSNDVKPLANGLYALVASPLVIRDLYDDDKFIDEMKMADPATFLVGQVAKYAGCAIIDAGSRANVDAGAAGDGADVHMSTMIGGDAVFAGLGGIKVYAVTGADKADRLNRRDSWGFKAFVGGIINDVQSNRFINIATVASL
jgi:N4-gp56 family major capsid protein